MQQALQPDKQQIDEAFQTWPCSLPWLAAAVRRIRPRGAVMTSAMLRREKK